ncbi:hypothetical protein FN846DRAFT_979015 [Sphaerosporella brunnea]|uniref:Uncharacterized protein n=1 Tax=Sphaerosporella brunnea TaxID=1250544 RepID=A0A5J5EDU6_9PEZI|nr:hypothetical protein FN846DRAFT_979009 [Sphaerosporella brunnea]KAA8893423.1 hypothetical protein FN846DRAFT_979015 [Sphaerosporella brunnea]
MAATTAAGCMGLGCAVVPRDLAEEVAVVIVVCLVVRIQALVGPDFCFCLSAAGWRQMGEGIGQTSSVFLLRYHAVDAAVAARGGGAGGYAEGFASPFGGKSGTQAEIAHQRNVNGTGSQSDERNRRNTSARKGKASFWMAGGRKLGIGGELL